MVSRLGKKRPRWREKRDRRDTGLSFIRQMSKVHVAVPPKGLPGFLMAALPFVILAALAWSVPGFWQLPATVAVLVLVGIVLLRIDWPRSVKTGFAIAVVAGSVLAFAMSGTAVGPFVLPVLAAGLALAFLRARAAERDIRDHDSWRER
jgi:hypothetical protein